MIFNIIYGKSAFATINASTQYSSSFTCSDGTITLSASGTSVSFVVPKSGAWTVTCTYGGLTKSNNVSVTTYGGTYATSFTFTKYLYHDGTQDVPWTITSSGGTFMPSYIYVTKLAYTSNSIDLTGYSNLVLQYTLDSEYATNYSYFGYAASSSSGFEGRVNLRKTSSKITATVDVSSINGSKVIMINPESTKNVNAYKVYLT